MPGGDAAGLPERQYSPTAYEEALDALSSLIVRRTRADGSNKGDQFDTLFDYLRIMELEGPISEMKVIHVAGTKGKGSTCAFTESILRNCGFSTGLFTSPHLIDIRERFQLNGVQISEEKFLAYFWWCWNRLKENCNEDVPMPTYFRFLALLGFKIFTAEHVDVAILEVGLGGKFDATNVVEKPVACGISSLGYDHMEILGNTLREIAGEKAGIFKPGVPAFTTTQPEEAMSALENMAAQLGISLQVVPPLDASSLNGLKLGLDGDHQYLNAGLAIALCRTLLQRAGRMEGTHLNQARSLPEEFVKGLATTNLQGRAQIVPDPCFHMQNDSVTDIGGLTFFLDGAHSPESMEVCAKWFSHAVKVDSEKQSSLAKQLYNSLSTKQDLVQNDVDNLNNGELSAKKSLQILLFNCMSVRDPQRLLPRLINACACHGIRFQKALFVPTQSVFNKVGSHALPMNDSAEVDLSWQLTLQKVWENLVHDDRGGKDAEPSDKVSGYSSSLVFPSLPLALKWLRGSAEENTPVHFQVLVTGSLHLVGDMLRLLEK